MAVGTAQTTNVPYREQIADASGVISRPWQDFFRGVKESIDGQCFTSTSDAFLLSTSGFASNEYALMTKNSISLPVGTFQINGLILASWTSSAPTWTYLRGLWSTANGDNSGTVPTSISYQAGYDSASMAINSVDDYRMPMPAARIRLSAPTDIFLVPKVRFTAAGDAFLKAFLYAEKISSSVGDGGGT